MKLYLVNTSRGLIPETDKDYDSKVQLKLGATYLADIRLVRNPSFHRKYFALINCAWEYMTEKESTHFKTSENFRKYIEIAAGHCDTIYSPKGWIEVPKSVSFSSMENAEFSDLYDRVKNVIFSLLGSRVSVEEFEKNLMNF